MATYNSGQVKFGTPGAVIDSTVPSRRLYDFSDRVADLAPEESPFFVYLSKVGKVPTTDSQFRFLEDRTKVSMTDRSFKVKGADSLAAAGSNTSLLVDTSGGAAVSWLIKGMVVQFAQNVNKDGGADTEAITQATARIESVTQNSADTTIVVKTIANSAGSGTTTLDDNGDCVVIGTSYEQGSGAPDVWSQEMDNDYGYTQIFKTACEMSNTARATVYRGYADEWQRIWNLKLREHKVDIERAMLFGMRGSQGGIQYTEGIVGNILVNGTATTDGSIGSYSEGVPYLASYATSELTYDGLLSAFETMYDPARGGSSAKLCLASLPVVSHFNKISGFAEGSMTASKSQYNFERSQGSFGHKVMKIETVHGDCSIVKEPLFRNNASGHMCFVDLDHVSYRPLVGNGVNRDTSIMTNVQAADEDLRKDMILTEAGLEVSLPETHALINLEGV
tara:strand:- start:1756 stop:3102 length:1347 start_codon:yes stop_codon:yes gene_type:complete